MVCQIMSIFCLDWIHQFQYLIRFLILKEGLHYLSNDKLCPGHFSWQEGYGAFTYSRSQLDDIYKYIENQEGHHSKESFRKEYISLLEKSKIDYDPMFLFDFFDDSEWTTQFCMPYRQQRPSVNYYSTMLYALRAIEW